MATGKSKSQWGYVSNVLAAIYATCGISIEADKFNPYSVSSEPVNKTMDDFFKDFAG